jgi:hypothetical protein
MLSTSSDILNLALSVCVVILTGFLCFALYYFASSMRKIHLVVKKIEQGVAKAEELVESARAKFKNSSAYFTILGELAKRALEFVQDKRAARKSASKKK